MFEVFIVNKYKYLSAILALSSAAYADDEMVITPDRVQQPIEATLAATTVISHEQIMANPSMDIGQLLANFAGLDVVRSGGPGQQTSVFMRGANSDQTLVMVDGVPVNTGTSGGVNLQYLLNPMDIDHIEVVRGPRSSLYGSQAVGGVINIITHRAGKTSTELQLTTGTEQTRQTDLRQDIQAGAFRASANIGNDNTQGYPQFYPTALNPTMPDGNYQHHGSASLSWHDQTTQVDAAYHQQLGVNQYLDFNNNPAEQNFYNSQGDVNIQWQPIAAWKSILNSSRTIDNIAQRQSSDFAYTGQNRVDWQNDIILHPGNNLTVGSTYTDQHNNASEYGTLYNNTFNTWANYLQDRWQLGDFSTQVAGRYESSDTWGHHLTGELTLGYALSASSSLYATHNTAFSAPTGDQLYGYGANPLLHPESASNYEVGSKNQWNAWELNLAMYRNHVSNLIQYVTTNPVTYSGENENVNQALLRGFETTLGYHQGPWGVHSELDLTRATDLSNQQDLLRRPRQTWTSDFDYSHKAWHFQASWLTASQSQDYSGIHLAGYGIVNLAAEWQALKWLKLQSGIQNIANRTYGQAANSSTSFYRAQPRLYTAGLDITY